MSNKIKTDITARIAALSAQYGSKAATTKGQHAAIMRAHQALPPLDERGNRIKYQRKKAQPSRLIAARLHDRAAANKADMAARKAHPRRENWETAEPVVTLESWTSPRVRDIDNGSYSRGCRFVHWTYRPIYRSGFFVAQSGAVAFACFADKPARKINAPSGMKWEVDELGAKLVSKDGTDWHPSKAETERRDFAATIRARMTAKRKMAKRSKQAAKDDVIRIIAAPPVSIVRASLAAGNCKAGTEQFLRNLGIRKIANRTARPAAMVRLARRHKQDERGDFKRALHAALEMAS
jgi:hypothetical protein